MEYSATKRQSGVRVTHRLFSKPFIMDFRLVKVRIGIRANGSCQKERKKTVNMWMVTVYTPVLFGLKTSDKWLTCML